MFSAWNVGINLRTVSNFSLVAANISRQAAMTERSVGGLRTKISGVGASATEARSRISGLARTASVADRSFTAFGLVAGASLAIGIKGAADLQSAMIQTALASKLGSVEMEKFHTTAMRMSDSTAQSVTQSMELLRTLATSGINKPAELQALAMPIARFADTQFLGKNHVAFNDSAAMSAKIAHMLGARTAAELTPVLDQLYRMSNDMPDSIALAANQLKQFAPFFKAAHVDNQTILNLQATADRMGMGGGYGGTGLGSMLKVLQTAPSKASFRAQQKLGMIDAQGGSQFIDRKSGQFDPLRMFEYINKKRQDATYQRDFTSLVNAAFSTANARRVVSSFSSDSGLEQYRGVVGQQSGMANVQQAQERLMDSLNGQTQRLTTNFQTLATELARPWLKNLTDLMRRGADTLSTAGSWAKDHPNASKIIAGGLAAATVYAAARIAAMTGNFVGAFVSIGKHGAHVGAGVGHAIGHGARGAATVAEGAAVASRVGFVARALPMALEMAMLVPLGRVIGKTAKAAFTFRGFRGIPGVRALESVLSHLGGAFKFLGFGGKLLVKMLPFLAGGLAKLGLRAIPVIGNILLLIDVLKFLGTHSKDIGKGIGIAAHWIVAHGVPIMIDAFKSLIFGIWQFVKDSIGGIFMGGKGGIVGVLENLRSGIIQGFGKEDNDARWNEQHRIEADRKKMAPPMTRNNANTNPLNVAPVINFHYHAPTTGDQASHERALLNTQRKLADSMGEAFAKTLRTSGRAAGQSPAMSGASGFEFAGAPG